MAWDDLLAALGLMLVLEGVLPFVAPGRFRRVLLSYASLENRWMRVVALASMLGGLLLIKAVK